MLAKNVNDDACYLNKHGVDEFFASKLAPTEGGFQPALRALCGNEHASSKNFTTVPMHAWRSSTWGM